MPVNYDQIAPTYDARFTTGLYDGVLDALLTLVRANQPEFVLEVGCGTGYWLSALRDTLPHLYGVDYSLSMLGKAHDRDPAAKLVRATAESLPFRTATFDLTFCVNAVHHFSRLDLFIAEARRLLRPRGILAVIGMDPHHGRDRWCVYDYFPETKAADLLRYPSSGHITDAMLRAGFDRIDSQVACRIEQTRVGRDILADPELQRRGCSQMALLTDAQYAAGIERINSALRHSNANSPLIFRADIAMLFHCAHLNA